MRHCYQFSINKDRREFDNITRVGEHYRKHIWNSQSDWFKMTSVRVLFAFAIRNTTICCITIFSRDVFIRNCYRLHDRIICFKVFGNSFALLIHFNLITKWVKMCLKTRKASSYWIDGIWCLTSFYSMSQKIY